MKCGEQQKKNGGEGGNEEVKGKASKRGCCVAKSILPTHVMSVTCVFVKAKMEGEQIGIRQKKTNTHTHIVLCVVVGDFIIL